MQKQNSRDKSRTAEPTNEKIAQLAYSLFEAEGRLNGHDLEHWLHAKEQLSGRRPSEFRASKE